MTRAQTWQALQSVGLRSGVDSLETFEDFVIKGYRRAADHLAVLRSEGHAFDPSPEALCTLHRMVYGDVFSWAGQFRELERAQGRPLDGGVPGQENTVHWQNLKGSSLEQPGAVEAIRREWADSGAGKQGKNLTAEQRAEGIALYYHGFQRIQPFTIGNGVIARLIMEEQAVQSFPELGKAGVSLSAKLDEDILLDDLRQFDRKDAIAPLRDHIMAAAGAEYATRTKDIDRQIAEANKGYGPDQGGGAPAAPSPPPVHAPAKGHQQEPGSISGPSSPSGAAADHSHDKDHGHDH